MAVRTNDESVIDQDGIKDRAKDNLQFSAMWALELIRLFRWPIVATIGGTALWVYFAGGLPKIPSDWWGYAVFFGVGTAVMWTPVSIALSYFRPNYTFLHEVLPRSGDAAGHALTDDQFDDLTVLVPDGVTEDDEVEWVEGDTDDLWTISIKSGVGYECVDYDPEANTAKVTWMGDASATEIRAFKSTLNLVQTKLSILADLGIEESISRTPIVRAITARLARYLVRTHQQGTIPNGEEIDGVVTDVLSEELGEDWETLEDKVDERLPAEYQQKLNEEGPFAPEAGDGNE